MKQEILKLGKHTFIYGAGIVISKSVSFIMLPVYTRYLTPVDYGVLELLAMTTDIIAMVVGVGLTSSVFKFYQEYEDPEEKKEIISTVSILLFVISLVTAIVGCLFSQPLSQLLFGQSSDHFYLQLFFIIFFLQSGILAVSALFMRAMHNSKLFVTITLIKLLIQVSLNIYFLVVLRLGVVGVLYSTLLADMIIGLYFLIYTFRRVGFRFSVSKGKSMVQFGYPFIFVSLSSFALTYSDRYFLNAFSNLDTVGIYSLAYKFGFMMGYIVVVPFEQIWEPTRFEIAKQQNALPIFKKVFLYFNIVVILLSLFISLFVKDILTIMSAPSYFKAHEVVPIVILAYVIQAWTYHCNLGIYLEGCTKHMAVASVLSAICVTVFNFLLIPRYGAYGAAWATVGAFFLRFILIYVISQKYYFIDYGWSKPVLLVFISSFLYLLSRASTVSYLPFSVIFNTILMLLFVVVIYKFFLDELAKAFIKEILKRLMMRCHISYQS